MSKNGHKVPRAGSPAPPPDFPMSKRGHALALITLSALALVLSVYLVVVHHRVRAEPGWHSACSISSTFDCDAVILSPYSTVAGAPSLARAFR